MEGAGEIGAGSASVELKGTENPDEITPEGFLGNDAGGVLGGISTGQDIVVSIALKPTSSLRLPGRSIDRASEPVEVVTTGRHDNCVGLQATPIAEAMTARAFVYHWLRHRGLNGDAPPVAPYPPFRPGPVCLNRFSAEMRFSARYDSTCEIRGGGPEQRVQLSWNLFAERPAAATQRPIPPRPEPREPISLSLRISSESHIRII